MLVRQEMTLFFSREKVLSGEMRSIPWRQLYMYVRATRKYRKFSVCIVSYCIMIVIEFIEVSQWIDTERKGIFVAVNFSTSFVKLFVIKYTDVKCENIFEKFKVILFFKNWKITNDHAQKFVYVYAHRSIYNHFQEYSMWEKETIMTWKKIRKFNPLTP